MPSDEKQPAENGKELKVKVVTEVSVASSGELVVKTATLTIPGGSLGDVNVSRLKTGAFAG